jgi:hypothetical protein
MTECYVTPELNQKESLSLSLTNYEAKLIKYELEQLPLEQLKEPFINSICKKIDKLL